MTTCEHCKGSGYITDYDGYYMWRCPDCDGNGQIKPPPPKPTLGEIWGRERWGKS